ncbi:hypothetical protein K435DRAFT_782634 [Dendrothele bispora CBS 962.96]|uniref:Uncharacterized protein n=1 Tax=Dendrothele bispora (strain CBS 962.96) TaxID=1314807 RepID=A0A4S8LF16_DENBC|nr:hypothetical protein K435DRAFT_782634 [Dendrothele bispora CBS 962.96]
MSTFSASSIGFQSNWSPIYFVFHLTSTNRQREQQHPGVTVDVKVDFSGVGQRLI